MNHIRVKGLIQRKGASQIEIARKNKDSKLYYDFIDIVDDNGDETRLHKVSVYNNLNALLVIGEEVEVLVCNLKKETEVVGVKNQHRQETIFNNISYKNYLTRHKYMVLGFYLFVVAMFFVSMIITGDIAFWLVSISAIIFIYTTMLTLGLFERLFVKRHMRDLLDKYEFNDVYFTVITPDGMRK
ncbi:hypothetical protein H2O73_01935 [Vibrio sp. 404]|uniref:Uncharacterized protein n=1 Tax=Vibrio marinisediminis TaxID=2758441 RepID=A0A7W2FMZ3_9VIBR|nr:hypothetical protein [Vibrio marinisediminis]MBA5761087.1 hypothetical protein [Vibrio marinisediminis]